MSIYAKGTFSGEYRPVGDPLSGDVLSLHEFGPELGGKPSEVMLELADVAISIQAKILSSSQLKIPIVGTTATDAALRIVSQDRVGADVLVEGDSSSLTGGGLGTKGELLALKKHMSGKGLQRPILVGQAYHIGRIGLQARNLGIEDIIVPVGLPATWAPESYQRWGQSKFGWWLRELVGVPYLHIDGKF